MPGSPGEVGQDDDVPPTARLDKVAGGRWAVTVLVLMVAVTWIVATGGPFDRTEVPAVPGAAGNGPAPDPFISMNAQLSSDSPVDLFKVKTSYPQYWRLYTLDRFDGESWRSSDPDGTKGGIEGEQMVHVSQPITPPADAQRASYTFTILSPGTGNALPLPEQMIPPTNLIDTAGDLAGNLTWDLQLQQVFVEGGLDAGLEYTFQSRIVVPTAQQVSALHFATAPNDGPWTQLPDDLDPRIARIAQEWTAGATSDYEKVLAIHYHLRGLDSEFIYSDSVPPLEGKDALYRFLHDTKTGFGQHFAIAEATLLRTVGIPTRIALGYQEGTLQDDRTYLVSTKDAHAWVEVLFPTYGWLPFDPSPGRGSIPRDSFGSYLNPGPGDP